jgi:hypothetical protein
VKDEHWGRVLVAQRDFAPGEVVIRSGVLINEARTVAQYVRKHHELQQAHLNNANIIAQFLQWATSSPRCAA